MIKTFFTLCSGFLSLVIFAQSTADVLHYRFEIELNDNNDSVYGKARILIKFSEPAATAELDLHQLKDGKGMQVYDVTGTGVKSREQIDNKIKINFNTAVKKDDTASFTIFYKGIPADGLIISKNKYGKRTFFADNWPNRARHWIPCHDDPADKASVEFIITAPSRYQVIANGIQAEESNITGAKKLSHWKEDVPLSTKVMAIGVAEFAVNLSGMVNGCIPVYSWVYPEDRDKGFYDYALAVDILPFYIKNIGPYAYKKLANVESKTMFGGLENANTIFYNEDGSINGKRESETLVAHEIAHQWFGNMATEKTFAHLWLSEGFATYMTTLYMENKYGTEKATAMLKEDRELVINYSRQNEKPVVNETKNYMELLNPNSYQKGGWILHMLRRELGDSVFWKGIRKYYVNYAGKTAGTDDLRKIFEEISGKNLQTFFQQWLYTPGVPKLKLTWKYLAKEKAVSLTAEQLQKNLFTMPLEIGFGDAATARKEKIMLTGKSQTFRFAAKTKPAMLIADPQTSLLFEGILTEVK